MQVKSNVTNNVGSCHKSNKTYAHQTAPCSSPGAAQNIKSTAGKNALTIHAATERFSTLADMEKGHIGLEVVLILFGSSKGLAKRPVKSCATLALALLTCQAAVTSYVHLVISCLSEVFLSFLPF